MIPDIVRRRFDGHAASVALEARTLSFAFATPEQGLAFWERTNGPMLALKHLTPPETYTAIRAQAAQLLTALNQADDGRVVLDSPYLQVIARKPIP